MSAAQAIASSRFLSAMGPMIEDEQKMNRVLNYIVSLREDGAPCQFSTEEIIAFARAHAVRAVNLLPYHSLGKTKWHQLQKDYQYGDEPGMKPAELKQYEDAVVSIGG